MARRELIKWKFILFLSLIAFQGIKAGNIKDDAYENLLHVNKNWSELKDEIKYEFTPYTEQETIQLHLLNVISYLESQPYKHLSEKQQENRQLNIFILREYYLAGKFPINNISEERIPIFIDSQNTHCAVGYLLKENGFGNVAQEIASNQLLDYLKDIEHHTLALWQKSSGLTLFELALIQPTYGPPIPICSFPSPIKWQELKTEKRRILQLYKSEKNASIYAVAQIDDLGLDHEIIRYNNKQEWISIGSQLEGQITDIIFCKDKIYISAFLPTEDFPHQLLKLVGKKWVKIAHFNGSIESIQTFQSKLYVLGSFHKVNDSIASNFIVIKDDLIKPFQAIGLQHTSFDQMKASETSLFLTAGGMIYKFKNDTIKHMASIQYYEYFKNFQMEAFEDTLFVVSLEIPGYYKYFDARNNASYINNMLNSQNYPYGPINLTKSKIINGNVLLSGDFKTSTLIPQINDERYLVKCAKRISSGEWFGGGLLYQQGSSYFPILNEGVVLDFVCANDQVYILKKDGSIHFSSINLIEEEIGNFYTVK